MAAPTASTWKCISEIGLNQDVTAVDTTRNYPIGHKIRCVDVGSTDRGEAEFVYWKGVASVAAGDLCMFDGGIVARSAARAVGPCGVAMGAITASSYGWFQVRGKAIVTADGTCADNGQGYVCATAGAVSTTVATGDMIHGCRVSTAVDTGQAVVDLMYPACADTDNT